MSSDDEFRALPEDRPVGPSSDPSSLRVTGLASGGDGVGRLSDGRVVFVDGGVPGDLVELVDLTTRKKLARARVGRLLEPSPDRVEPRCSHFDVCGGCRWQHVRYEAQLEAKRKIVRDALERIGGLVLERDVEILGSPDPYAYRARARLVESEGRVGYRIRGSHAIQGINECPILVPSSREALIQLSRSVASVARHSAAEESGTKTRPRRASTEWILSAGTAGPAIVAEVHRKTGGKGAARIPQESVTLDVLGESLRASSESFIQGNALMWDALAGEVRLQCTTPDGESSPKRFVELYAGIGFLTIPLARCGLSGVAIESDRSALADLATNLAGCGLEKQVEIVRGRVEARRDLAKRFALADVLLMDPPRVGLEAITRDAIIAAAPKRLVYVSCDPATLARDLRVFTSSGYALVSVRALDLFPQTPHVEIVARLARVDSQGSIRP
jgi:23S rRNA (uracil1939-C5)-methyltransferase